MRLQVHVFQLHEDGPAAEELEEDSDVSAASHWMLPSGKSQSDIHNTHQTPCFMFYTCWKDSDGM